MDCSQKYQQASKQKFVSLQNMLTFPNFQHTQISKQKKICIQDFPSFEDFLKSRPQKILDPKKQKLKDTILKDFKSYIQSPTQNTKEQCKFGENYNYSPGNFNKDYSQEFENMGQITFVNETNDKRQVDEILYRQKCLLEEQAFKESPFKNFNGSFTKEVNPNQIKSSLYEFTRNQNKSIILKQLFTQNKKKNQQITLEKDKQKKGDRKIVLKLNFKKNQSLKGQIVVGLQQIKTTNSLFVRLSTRFFERTFYFNLKSLFSKTYLEQKFRYNEFQRYVCPKYFLHNFQEVVLRNIQSDIYTPPNQILNELIKVVCNNKTEEQNKLQIDAYQIYSKFFNVQRSLIINFIDLILKNLKQLIL